MAVPEDEVGPLPTVAVERVGAPLAVVASGAEAGRSEHLVQDVVDRVMPAVSAFAVAVAHATQSMVAVAVHVLGLGVADRASVRVA